MSFKCKHHSNLIENKQMLFNSVCNDLLTHSQLPLRYDAVINDEIKWCNIGYFQGELLRVPLPVERD